MRKTNLLLVTIVIIIFLGCSQRIEGKVIVEDYKNVSTNLSEMIDVHQEIDGITWLNDNQLIENHKDGLYVRNTASKQTTLLLQTPDLYPVTSLSPDKKHLLLAKDYLDMGNTYYVFNLKTKKLVQVQSKPINLYYLDPKWIDNEHLLASDTKGNIYQIHISGKVTKYPHKLRHYDDREEWYQLDKAGEQFFYVEDHKLWVWNERTKQTKKLMDRVDQFSLSPDRKQLAVVQVVPTLPSEAEQEDVLLGTDTLVLMDLTGKVQTTITRASFISTNIIWSKDGHKLAYISTDQEQPPKLYVAKTKQNAAPTLLAVNLDGELKEWNSSGTKICMNGYVNLQSPEDGSALHIIQIK